MYAIAFFGSLLTLLSAVMIIDPDRFSSGIVRLSRAKYFHGFEVVSRLGFGAVFIAYSEQTRYPAVMEVIGYLLVAVGVGLLLTPPSKHRQFALWSAKKFRRVFRPAGMVSIVFGLFIVYGALKVS